MPTVTEVRNGLADAIAAGTDLRTSPLVLDTMVPPIAVVARQAFDPRYVFSQSKAAYPFYVRLFAGRTDERSAQDKLDTWCELSGTNSVIAAIQTDANWGTVDVDYAVVTNIGEVQSAAIGESVYLTVELSVEVVF